MTSKYGLFSEPTYLNPGITYKKEPVAKRIDNTTPPNIKVAGSHSGKGNDATFDKFKPLYEKELFSEHPTKGVAKVDNPWKIPSPMKRSSGLGSHYGTLQGNLQYISPTLPADSNSTKKNDALRGIYTAPSKKGSYGTTRTTLSQLNTPFGVVSEYEYKADGYRSLHEIAMTDSKLERSRRITEQAFKPAGSCQKRVYGTGVCGEYAYFPQGDGTTLNKKDASTKVEVPFKPSGKVKNGVTGTIGRFPEFLPSNDPASSGIDKQEEKITTTSNPWKPSSTNKTDCVKSIVKLNV